MNDFYKEKIMYSEIVQDSQFYLDSVGYFPEATTFIMTGKDLDILLLFLNSKLLTYAFKIFYAGGGLGEGFRYKKAFLNNLPIPILDDKSKKEYQNLLSQLINKDIDKDIKNKIDILIEKFYELSDEEIEFIDFQ